MPALRERAIPKLAEAATKVEPKPRKCTGPVIDISSDTEDEETAAYKKSSTTSPSALTPIAKRALSAFEAPEAAEAVSTGKRPKVKSERDERLPPSAAQPRASTSRRTRIDMSRLRPSIRQFFKLAGIEAKEDLEELGLKEEDIPQFHGKVELFCERMKPCSAAAAKAELQRIVEVISLQGLFKM